MLAGLPMDSRRLTTNVEVSYLISEPYRPEAAAGIRYNDGLGIKWPLEVTEISDEDLQWPDLTHWS
jgi:dTDP-4-dehydrorhamnose 3,5-epimerase